MEEGESYVLFQLLGNYGSAEIKTFDIFICHLLEDLICFSD